MLVTLSLPASVTGPVDFSAFSLFAAHVSFELMEIVVGIYMLTLAFVVIFDNGCSSSAVEGEGSSYIHFPPALSAFLPFVV